MKLKNAAAIAGIGATEFSRDAGRSELQLACEATVAACEDAGLPVEAIDGMVTFTLDGTEEIDIARSLGIPKLTFFSRVPHGGGAACAIVHQAAMAVATGAAEAVVAYRSLRQGRAGRQNRAAAGQAPPQQQRRPQGGRTNWYAPYGLATPASWVAMFARRYMHESGATSEDFGRVSVADRKHASTNPNALYYGKPITLEDHQNSRWIVEPLHLLDCCQQNDGATACIVTTVERARDLKQPAAIITAAAQGSWDDQESMTSYYRPDIGTLPEVTLVGEQLWNTAKLGPKDIDAAVLYDHFTPFVLVQLESLGFCARGEAKDFVKDGNIEIGGTLPVNTNGGQLGEAYIHGMNGVNEGVRLVRGTSPNQPDGTEHVLVTAGTGVPTSGLILGRDT